MCLPDITLQTAQLLFVSTFPVECLSQLGRKDEEKTPRGTQRKKRRRREIKDGKRKETEQRQKGEKKQGWEEHSNEK